MENSAGSEYDRLFYPFLFAGGRANPAEVLAQVKHSIQEKCREVCELRRSTLASMGPLLVATGQAMAHAFAEGATLLTFGNGGSATDAQDLATDLLNPPFSHWRPLPALALQESAIITAVGNDVGIENIFDRQVIAFGKPGDIALAVSTSGNSPNLLAALEQARRQGMLTIGLAGYDGGNMRESEAVDFCLYVPGNHIPRIQEVQATIYHTLLEIVHALLEPYEKEGNSTRINLRKEFVR